MIGNAAQACINSGRHYLGFEEDEPIFKALLQPLIAVKQPSPISNASEKRPTSGFGDSGFSDAGFLDIGVIQAPKRRRPNM